MENPYWHGSLKPHVVDFHEVRDLCFQAFSVLRASRSMIGLPEEDVGGRLADLFFARAEPTLTAALLRLALTMRIFEDVMIMQERKSEYDAFLEQNLRCSHCGSIGFDDAYMGERHDLSFREACNKIIHAQDIRPFYSNGFDARDEDYAWGMEGTVEIGGVLGKRGWDVWLGAEEFLEACLLIANRFDADIVTKR